MLSAADFSGEYVYSDTTRHRMVFDMEARIPDNSEVTMAELKLYQRASHQKRYAMEKKNHHRLISNARVSVYWVEVQRDGSNRTSLVDSRCVTTSPPASDANTSADHPPSKLRLLISRSHRLTPIHETGWKSFDVTQAVHYWSKSEQETPMHLEVWIEGERPGSYAAEVAKSVRFTTQEQTGNALGKPELILYTLSLEEYG